MISMATSVFLFLVEKNMIETHMDIDKSDLVD